MGRDGPLPDGALVDRNWSLPGVDERSALDETFLEVMDAQGVAVLLLRLPGKVPIELYLDTRNPFLRTYPGGFSGAR